MDFGPAMLAWFVLALGVTLTPGPDTMLVAGHAARGGARAGLAATAGIVAGGLWYVALCGFGYLGFVSASPQLFMLVKAVGAIYLGYVGAKMIIGAFKGETVVRKPVSLGAPFRQGLLTNALNPKIAVFYLAALPQFVGQGEAAPMTGVLLIAVHYVLGALWLSTVALGVARAGRVLEKSRVMRAFEGAIGAFLVALAGRLAFERTA
jgi:threonine/homoserine/homoserine lactone efflux protein